MRDERLAGSGRQSIVVGGCILCELYSVYALLSLCCAWSVVYLVYTVIGVCCNWCMLKLVYAVIGVCCTWCELIIMIWRDREG